MTMADLANYKGEWVEPVTSDYHGFTLTELPPPSQGFAANEMLNILAACTGMVYPGQTLASLGPTDARYWHMLVEAKTLAYADLNRLQRRSRFQSRLGRQGEDASTYAGLCQKPVRQDQPDQGDDGARTARAATATPIVLSTADRWGNMVSWVNTNYASFGSGITVPGYGFILHNRGGLFTLDPAQPQRDRAPQAALQHARRRLRAAGRPHRRPDDGAAADGRRHAVPGPCPDDGEHGGSGRQSAGLHRHGALPSQSGARHCDLESQFYKLVGAQLQAMGHNVVSANGGGMGGYQAILFTPDPKEKALPFPDNTRPVNGFYRAGSDHRKDGEAIGW